jgi:branched-chain amino acid transport system permease protein
MRLPAAIGSAHLPGRIKGERLIMPLAFLAVTAAVVIVPAQQSGWSFDSTISVLAFFATFVAIYAILSIGLNVQWGYAGVFNFGVMAFFLVGAYTAALMTKGPASGGDQYMFGLGDVLDFIPVLDSEQWLPFLFGAAGAAVTAGVLAFFLSIPALRLREDYLAIATIGIAELLRRVTIEEPELVNGTRALKGIPRPLGGWSIPTPWGRLGDEPDEYKFVIFGIAVVVLLVVYIAVERGIRSPWGRVLRALREDELTTAASGKNVFAFKSQGFVLGAMIMGLGGAVYAYANSVLSPNTFSHFFSTFIFWAMLIVGGSGNNKGAILGAYMVWGIWTTTANIQGYDLPAAFGDRIPYVRQLFVGALIILVLLLRPRGLVPEERRVSTWVEQYTKRQEPAAAKPPEAHQTE